MKIPVQPLRRKVTQGVKFTMGTSSNYGQAASDVRISDNEDWASYIELFTQYRINSITAKLIPARGASEDGIYAFSARHDPEADDTMSTFASVAQAMEGYTPVLFGPVSKGGNLPLPVNKEWRDLETVQQDSSVDWACRVEDGPASGAVIFMILFVFDVTFR